MSEPAPEPAFLMADVSIDGGASWQVTDYESEQIRAALAITDEAQRQAAMREATEELREEALLGVTLLVEIYEPRPRGFRNVLWTGKHPEPQS